MSGAWTPWSLTSDTVSRSNKRARGSDSPGEGAAGTSGGSSQRRRTSTNEAGGERDGDKEEEEGEDEPDTEEDEDVVKVVDPVPSGSGTRSSPARRLTAEAADVPVLDLTDEGDDTASSPAPVASGSSSHSVSRRLLPHRLSSTPNTGRREGVSTFDTITVGDDYPTSSDDEVEVSPRKSSSKGKGKAKAASSPFAPPPVSSTVPIPSAPSGPSAVPLGADGDPLPTLNHLTCPICFGSPSPLALTSCGHAFCASCLHAALVAGPALTPPPLAGGPPRARRRGHGYAAETGRLFTPGTRGGRGGGRGGRTVGGGPADDEDEGDPDLDKHCPVCRTALKGGWGKSLRGLVLRMGPAKKKTVEAAA